MQPRLFIGWCMYDMREKVAFLYGRCALITSKYCIEGINNKKAFFWKDDSDL